MPAVQDGRMSGSGTLPEFDADKAQATFEKVEQVLQIVEKIHQGPPRGRAFFRAALVLIAGGVVLLAAAVLESRRDD